MRAKAKVKITDTHRFPTGEVQIKFETLTPGKVDTRAMNAQDITLSGEFTVRALIAEQMKIGATISISLTDEETDENSH